MCWKTQAIVQPNNGKEKHKSVRTSDIEGDSDEILASKIGSCFSSSNYEKWKKGAEGKGKGNKQFRPIKMPIILAMAAMVTMAGMV